MVLILRNVYLQHQAWSRPVKYQVFPVVLLGETFEHGIDH